MLTDLKTDDEGRVRAVDRYEVMDSEEERPFETVVTLVQQILKAPVCVVSILDRDRQWFKARRGIDVTETPRDVSFCTIAIQNDHPLVVSDATIDPRFMSNPLVTGEPYIRSYAGIPLRSPDGYNIGSLCVVDFTPREFPQFEIDILRNFAKVVMDELELRQIATTDVLTGALTRRAWSEKAETAITRARESGDPLSIALFDIDRFKRVNDTHGHAAGDQVIRAMADHVMANQAGSDQFGRYGGEEFVLLMRGADPAEAERRVDAIRAGFEALKIPIGEVEPLSCTVSIGVAGLRPSDSLHPLVERADRALYAAKTGGRNRVVPDSKLDDAQAAE